LDRKSDFDLLGVLKDLITLSSVVKGWGPCFLYKLGLGIKPNKEIKTGAKIQRSMLVWAMIDLLLTCSTLEEARDRSKLRNGCR
jgi:hypothetical protein